MFAAALLSNLELELEAARCAMIIIIIAGLRLAGLLLIENSLEKSTAFAMRRR